MTDFRELCAELVHLNEVEVDDWTRKWADAIKRTKAALAEGAGVARPIPVAERPWEREGFCDAEGRCWFGAPDRPGAVASWDLEREPSTDDTHCLPATAIPLPEQDENCATQS